MDVSGLMDVLAAEYVCQRVTSGFIKHAKLRRCVEVAIEFTYRIVEEVSLFYHLGLTFNMLETNSL